jgi:hypothetical protein
MQGPNTSKRIIVTIGLRKGRNQVLEGSQDFIWSHTCIETCFKRLLLEPLSLLENVICMFLYNT